MEFEPEGRLDIKGVGPAVGVGWRLVCKHGPTPRLVVVLLGEPPFQSEKVTPELGCSSQGLWSEVRR